MNYVAKVKVLLDTDGKIKKVTEQYLVKAESVTDVEAIVTKAFEGEQVDWELCGVSESKIRRVLNFKH